MATEMTECSEVLPAAEEINEMVAELDTATYKGWERLECGQTSGEG